MRSIVQKRFKSLIVLCNITKIFKNQAWIAENIHAKNSLITPLWKSWISLRDQLLVDCGGQSEVISMMQNWDNIYEPFSVMLMSFWDLKEPQCHRLRLFGNLGVYQGIVSSFGMLYLGGWEHEIGCTLLMLMLAASSIRIMRKAIITFSLLAVGHPSYGRRLNLGFDSAGVWPPLVVLFGASILKEKTLLPEWKGSPSALLSI